MPSKADSDARCAGCGMLGTMSSSYHVHCQPGVDCNIGYLCMVAPLAVMIAGSRRNVEIEGVLDPVEMQVFGSGLECNVSARRIFFPVSLIRLDSTNPTVSEMEAATGSGGGHYTAYVRSRGCHNWYFVDDGAPLRQAHPQHVEKTAFYVVLLSTQQPNPATSHPGNIATSLDPTVDFDIFRQLEQSNCCFCRTVAESTLQVGQLFFVWSHVSLR